MINVNWARWIHASINKQFNDNCHSTVKLYIEGTERNTRAIKNFLELRIDGPKIDEISRNYYRLYVEINILAQALLDVDIYQLQRLVGLAQSLFVDIPVYKYGTGTEDTEALLGCLQRITSVRGSEFIDATNFGQIAPDNKINQATIETHYEMFLNGD